jgi:glycosyltransferase involved in cell wall biosynthesis
MDEDRHRKNGRPRVAFILAGLGAGGAERVIAEVSERFVLDGADVSVIAFDRPDEPTFHRFHPRVRLIRLGLPSRGGRFAAPARALNRAARLRQILRAGRFDVAISFLTKINALALLASIGLRLPVIVSERNNPLRQPHHRLWQTAVNLLYRRARAIVIQTERARICLPHRERARATVIGNPVSAPAATPRGAELAQCVGVGRLVQQKGFDLLIDAFARTAPDFPRWRLVIWGEGPERPALERRIAALGLNSQATLAGNSPSPGSWAETATMLVLSSRFEGSPNVVAEAMASGIPVIAADCDFGPSELIDDGQNGLLVPPEDAAALAGAMSRMMSDAGLRKRLGQAGQRSMRNRARSDRIMAQWRDVVRGAINNEGAASSDIRPGFAASTSL